MSDRITPLFTFPSPHGVVQGLHVDYAPGGYTPGTPIATPPARTSTSSRARSASASNGATPRVLRAGDSLYEGSDDVHSVSANASESAPARLIAFFVLPAGQPSTVAA